MHIHLLFSFHRPVKKPLVPEPVAKSVVEPSPLLPKSETTSKPNEGLLTALPKPVEDTLKPIIDEVKAIEAKPTTSLKNFRPTKTVRPEPEINTEPAKVELNKPVMAEPETASSSSSWGKEMDQIVKLDSKSGPKTEPAVVKPTESKPLVKPETKKPEVVEKIVKPVVESKAAEPLTKTEPAISSKVTAATPLSPPKTAAAPPLPVSQPLKATARPSPTPPSPSKSPVKSEPELKKSEIKVQETEKKQQENGKKTEPKLASPPLPALETVN